MQINEFVNTLEEVNGTGTALTGDQRRLIQSISQDLNAALTPSKSADDSERPIPPQDLQTAVILVAVVAEWVTIICNNSH